MLNPTLPGYVPTDAEAVKEMPLQKRTERAIYLIQSNEPPDGYYWQCPNLIMTWHG